MCGIMGYVGSADATPIIMDGLRRPEYRGYESAGIAANEGGITVRKPEGNIDQLEALPEAAPASGPNGTGQTLQTTSTIAR